MDKYQLVDDCVGDFFSFTLFVNWVAPYKRAIKNFGRFDNLSKRTCLSVALSLNDAGLHYSKDTTQDIAIVGFNNEGSLQSNIRYFKDYVESGRKLARGNYFAYTLSTSSLSEASIAFGLNGAVLSIMPASASMMKPILEEHARLAVSQAVIVVINDEESMVSCVLGKQAKEKDNKIGSENEWYDIVGNANTVPEIVERVAGYMNER